MATAILMPKLGLTMTEGTIEEWKKKEGDEVKKGEILFSVETDKLTTDVEAEADGVLLKILVPAGETVACKTLIGWLGAAGEAVLRMETEQTEPVELRFTIVTEIQVILQEPISMLGARNWFAMKIVFIMNMVHLRNQRLL